MLSEDTEISGVDVLVVVVVIITITSAYVCGG